MKDNSLIISLLLICAILLYYFGYDLCHFLYNQYDYPPGTEIRKQVAKSFWELRFSNYSIIIAIILYTTRFKFNKTNKSIAKIGFNLAFISAVDKIIFKEFDFNNFDIYIFLILIVWEIYKHKNELHKKISKRKQFIGRWNNRCKYTFKNERRI